MGVYRVLPILAADVTVVSNSSSSIRHSIIYLCIEDIWEVMRKGGLASPDVLACGRSMSAMALDRLLCL